MNTLTSPLDFPEDQPLIVACPDDDKAGAMRRCAKARPDLFLPGLGYWQGEHEVSYTMTLATFAALRDLGMFANQAAVIWLCPEWDGRREAIERPPARDYPAYRRLGTWGEGVGTKEAWTYYPAAGYYSAA